MEVQVLPEGVSRHLPKRAADVILAEGELLCDLIKREIFVVMRIQVVCDPAGIGMDRVHRRRSADLVLPVEIPGHVCKEQNRLQIHHQLIMRAAGPGLLLEKVVVIQEPALLLRRQMIDAVVLVKIPDQVQLRVLTVEALHLVRGDVENDPVVPEISLGDRARGMNQV